MIGHTSKVLLGVGLALCVTLYWTQSRLSASAPPGPQPEIQPQFATLGGGVRSSMPAPQAMEKTRAASALRPAEHKPNRKRKANKAGARARRQAQTVKQASGETLEQLLDVGMLAPGGTVTDQDGPQGEGEGGEGEGGEGDYVEEDEEEEDTSDWGGSRPKVQVLVWNQINGFVDWLRDDFLNDARSKCSTECHFSSDRSLLSSAHGVLFHGPTHDVHDFPPPQSKPKGQKYIFMSLEQPHYFRDPALLRMPEKKPCCRAKIEHEGRQRKQASRALQRSETYASQFDYSATYELDSTVPITCIHPHWDAKDYLAIQPKDFADKDGFGAPGAAVMFTSNCRNAGAEKRLEFLEELGKHMDVHSYGKCLHNKDEPPAPQGVSRAVNKQRVLSRYKFYLAFENNVIRDYVSEKVFDGLLAGSLPVYWGTSSVDRYMPGPHAVIHARDFDGPKELAAYLKQVASNRTLYESYFEWKKAPAPAKSFEKVLDSTAYKYTSMCNICEALARKKRRRRLDAPLMDFTTA